MVDSTAVTKQVHLACVDQKTLKYRLSGKKLLFFSLIVGVGSHKWFSFNYSRPITKLTMDYEIDYWLNTHVQDLK